MGTLTPMETSTVVDFAEILDVVAGRVIERATLTAFSVSEDTPRG